MPGEWLGTPWLAMLTRTPAVHGGVSHRTGPPTPLSTLHQSSGMLWYVPLNVQGGEGLLLGSTPSIPHQCVRVLLLGFLLHRGLWVVCPGTREEPVLG